MKPADVQKLQTANALRREEDRIKSFLWDLERRLKEAVNEGNVTPQGGNIIYSYDDTSFDSEQLKAAQEFFERNGWTVTYDKVLRIRVVSYEGRDPYEAERYYVPRFSIRLKK